jgi:tripartite-type tricarboxylate transporter receptor subunit TctC
MLKRRDLLGAAAAAAVPAWPVQAQDLRAKTMRIVVSAPAGSAPDVIARILGERFQARFGNTVLIENRPGAGGILAVNATKAAPADGTVLLFAQAAVVAVSPHTYREAKWDMERDYEAVAAVANTPMLFVANPEKGPKTWAEALAAAKAAPEKVTIGNPARTSIPHLAALLVDQRASTRFMHVPFSNTGQAIQAVVNGDTVMSVDGIAALLPLVKSGRLRALAMTSAHPLPGYEGIPLAREAVPGLDVSGWFVLFAPKGTPSAVVNALNAATNDALKDPQSIKRLRDLGNEAMGGSAADAAAFVKKEKNLWAGVIRQAGIESE